MEVVVKFKRPLLGTILATLFIVFFIVLLSGEIMSAGNLMYAIVLSIVLLVLVAFLLGVLKNFISHKLIFNENGILLLDGKGSVWEDIPLDYIISWKYNEESQGKHFITLNTVSGSLQFVKQEYINFEEVLEFLKFHFPDKENVESEFLGHIALPNESQLVMYYTVFVGLLFYLMIYVLYSKDWNNKTSSIHKGIISQIDFVQTRHGSNTGVFLELKSDSSFVYRISRNKEAVREFERYNFKSYGEKDYIHLGDSVELSISKVEEDYYYRYRVFQHLFFNRKKVFEVRDYKLISNENGNSTL